MADDPSYNSIREHLNKLIANNNEAGISTRLSNARKVKDSVYKIYHETERVLSRAKTVRKDIPVTGIDNKKARADIEVAINETQKARSTLSIAHTKLTNAIKMIEKLDRKK